MTERLSPAPLPARTLVVAPRMPVTPKEYYGFDSQDDIYAECETCRLLGGERYHVIGPRPDVKAALDEHHRLYHPEELGVVLLNTPRQ